MFFFGGGYISLTFLRPTKKGSDFASADAVGGVGGVLLHTPNVVMATPRKAGIENNSSCASKTQH